MYPRMNASGPLVASLPPQPGGAVDDLPRKLAALERTLTVYKGLIEVSALIAAITDFDELLTAIMEVARRVMGARRSAVARGKNGDSLRPRHRRLGL
jgi:hypothetical protein